MGKVSDEFSLLEILSDGNSHKIEELAYKLEVSPRAIRSYKEGLEIAGIYIEWKRGRYGGYRINMKDYRYLEFIVTIQLLNNII